MINQVSWGGHGIGVDNTKVTKTRPLRKMACSQADHWAVVAWRGVHKKEKMGG